MEFVIRKDRNPLELKNTLMDLCCGTVGVLAAPVLTRLLAEVHGRQQKMSPRTWSLPPTWETWSSQFLASVWPKLPLWSFRE